MALLTRTERAMALRTRTERAMALEGHSQSVPSTSPRTVVLARPCGEGPRGAFPAPDQARSPEQPCQPYPKTNY